MVMFVFPNTLVDVIVRDGSGAVVRGLKAADFEIVEDGKPQEIRSFSFEEIKDHPAAGVETADLLAGAKDKLAEDLHRTRVPAGAAAPASAATPKPMTSEQLAGRRLIVLLFDIASMQPEDVQRAVDSATTFVGAANARIAMTMAMKMDGLDGRCISGFESLSGSSIRRNRWSLVPSAGYNFTKPKAN